MKKQLMTLALASILVCGTSCLKNNSDDAQSTSSASNEAVDEIEVDNATESEAVVDVDDENASDGETDARVIPDNVPEALRAIIMADKDIVVLPSGLAYKVIKAGEGAKPATNNVATVNYVGKHLDGSVFDQSQQPVSFPLQGVVAGFREGITQMAPGASYVLYLPSDLAYGENGTPGGPIAPNEPLIFEVELISFN